MHHRLSLLERTETEAALEKWQLELKEEQQLDENEFGPDEYVPLILGKQTEAIEMRADATYPIEPGGRRRVWTPEQWALDHPHLAGGGRYTRYGFAPVASAEPALVDGVSVDSEDVEWRKTWGVE